MEDISFFAIRTLIFMKLKIFFKEYIYSIISPLISSILFILILIILSNYYKFSSNNNYINFIIPGIIMMIIFQETFSNISETIITLKHSGTFKDIIISPISRVEIAIAYLISIMIIGLIIGSINLIVINFILDFTLYNYLRFFYYIALASLIFGSMGAIVGFLSYSWETQQGLFNFFITPVSLLSGTFFSISSIENNMNNINVLINCPRKIFSKNFFLKIKNTLEWVHIGGAGCEEYLFPEFVNSDVILTNGKIIQGPEVSDDALALLLCISRNLNYVIKNKENIMPRPIELRNKKVLILGVGGIGSLIAEKLSALGMHVIGVDQRLVPMNSFIDEFYYQHDLEHVINKADVVISAVPATNDSNKVFSNNILKI